MTPRTFKPKETINLVRKVDLLTAFSVFFHQVFKGAVIIYKCITYINNLEYIQNVIKN